MKHIFEFTLHESFSGAFLKAHADSFIKASISLYFCVCRKLFYSDYILISGQQVMLVKSHTKIMILSTWRVLPALARDLMLLTHI